jgi:hypothetical protein
MRSQQPFNSFTFLRQCLFPLLFALLLSGCSLSTRFIFAPTHDIQGSPDQAGLPYEDVWFLAEDGVRLNGWLIPGAPEKPLILFFHGNAANITHRIELLDYLHRLGFAVFIFDYRGFGRSEGFPVSEADLQRDARGALAWLRERDWPAERLIYFGSSLGSAVALQAALETPPTGLILEAPFTSLAGIARHMTPVIYGLFGWWSIGNDFDNLARIDRLTTPLLIFHGDRDNIVPLRMSRQLFAQAPEPKYLFVVRGGGHSDCFATGGADYRQILLQFALPVRAALLEPPRQTTADRPDGR